MISPQKYHVVQRILLWGLLFLALFYALVYRPLCDNVEALDRPLTEAWTKLLRTRLVEGGPAGVNTAALDFRLRELELAAARLDTLSNSLAMQIAFSGPVASKMKRSFQLVDFQNERQLSQEELTSLASAQSLALPPAIPAGYPEYSADLAHPELLWGHLAVAHETLKLALRCEVTNLVALTARPPRAIPAGETGIPLAYELPVSLNCAGSWPAIARFLTSLPLRSGEPRPAGLPEIPASKPAFHIERIILRKDAPERPNGARLEVRVVGVVLAGPNLTAP
jgi:hypothetical protein